MKTKLLYSMMLGLSLTWSGAQNRTTVSATDSEISDNLDLRAVASIFGEARDLEDFERRLNNPETPISNLDLNLDNQVDYLRVVESIEGNQHIIVVQAVLGRDQYQDVATVEVEKDSRNRRVQVQVVGDTFLYGTNYIYEPVYVGTPVIYNYFWQPYYQPYCSSWYWGFYPSYYYAWHPFPIFRYRHHIGLCINFGFQYNYVNFRRCHWGYSHYFGRRGNFIERHHPQRGFAYRNQGVANRYELDRTRTVRNVAYPDTRSPLAGTRDNQTATRPETGSVRGNWTSASETRPVRQDYTSNAATTPRPTRADYSVTPNPRPVRQNFSNTTASPRPVRENYTLASNTSTPRPTRSDYSTTTATPRPSRQDYTPSTTTVSPRPVRQEYTPSSSSVSPRPVRQDYSAPTPRPSRQEYTPSSSSVSPRPVRQDYSVPTPRPSRQEYSSSSATRSMRSENGTSSRLSRN
ncbi:hypothetical protein [Flavobacterium sp.]|jgi:hypothetical protein|uniref:hypothetical protein n=1 Tax=Flavobacterium sp. TaxID=239 RepID=UPI0022C6E66D|nr:hypothetical protein [Flavobacterium sp.]MCZ8143999.1 hypothetical protein [Flavobacterium sp.]MCZ8366484.1 hypothetical protein [Flavobacterium sp.]